MSYVVRKKNGKTLLLLSDQEVNGDYSITFTGRRVNSYGEIQQDNFLWLMQNFANDVAPINPVVGQLWYDTVHTQLYLCQESIADGGNSNVWSKVYINTTAQPDNPEAGDLWYDLDKDQLKVWTASNTWNIIGPSMPDNHVIVEQSQVVETNTTGSEGAQQLTAVIPLELTGVVAYKATIIAKSRSNPQASCAMWIVEGLFYVDPVDDTAIAIDVADVRKRATKTRTDPDYDLFDDPNCLWNVASGGGGTQVEKTDQGINVSFLVSGASNQGSSDNVVWTLDLDVVANNK